MRRPEAGGVDLQAIKARLAARAGRSWSNGPKKAKAPPQPVVKKQEERKELLLASQRLHRRRVVEAAEKHRNFARLMDILDDETETTELVEPGVVDVDLEHLLKRLKIHQLPFETRVLALTEVHQFIRDVHKRRAKTRDITPYAHLFDAGFVDSLDEARLALGLT